MLTVIKTLAIAAVVLAVAIVRRHPPLRGRRAGRRRSSSAGIALGGVAWTIGIATESVGARFGPAVTGALQSTLGNLPELFIVLFALSAGELVVAQFSILGSLFANALLVLGLAIAAGSAKRADGTMRSAARLPNDTATLLLLAVFLISILGLSDQVGDRASEHQVEISVVGAICLLVVYGAWLFGYLRSDKSSEASLAEPSPRGAAVQARDRRSSPCRASLAALVSEWFVDALDPAVEALGISKAFTGLVIVAIAGNAVENVVGVQLAWKGQNDLAISVVKNSVAQIACFLFPGARARLAPLRRTGSRSWSSPVYLGALALTAIAALADHRRRRGGALRGARARQPLRRARDARLVRVSGHEARRGAAGARTSSRVSSRQSPGSEPARRRAPRSALRRSRHDRVADRLEHPPHLAVAALVEHELDPRRPEPPDARRRRRPVVELDALARARRSAASSGSPSTSAT